MGLCSMHSREACATQNENFSANCTRLGARKELICAKLVAVMLVLAKPLGFTQFSVFRVSRRNWVLNFSPTMGFFSNGASVLKKPGFRRTPMPALPGRTTPCGTGAKQAC